MEKIGNSNQHLPIQSANLKTDTVRHFDKGSAELVDNNLIFARKKRWYNSFYALKNKSRVLVCNFKV